MNGAVPIGLTQLKYETNGWVESVAGAVTAVVSLDPSSGDLDSCGERFHGAGGGVFGDAQAGGDVSGPYRRRFGRAVPDPPPGLDTRSVWSLRLVGALGAHADRQPAARRTQVSAGRGLRPSSRAVPALVPWWFWTSSSGPVTAAGDSLTCTFCSRWIEDQGDDNSTGPEELPVTNPRWAKAGSDR
jgi:hypothetical protein